MASIKLSTDNLQKVFEEGNSLRQQGYRGRFAPSPTGFLHFGNLRTALISWLKARVEDGAWFIRIDDLDIPRNRSGSVERILEDISWLGLDWDGPIIFQSKREDIYYLVLSILLNSGRLFSCRCSRKMIRNISQNLNDNYIYPGTCRNLKLPFEQAENVTRSWRLKVDNKFTKTCGDIILRRADGFVSYHFANVVDDLLLGINEIVRGSDLENAKFAQLAIIDALNQKPPSYMHIPILLDTDGTKLSKGNDAMSLSSLRDKGINSPKVIGWLASSLGLVPLNSTLSCLELLADLKSKNISLDKLFQNRISLKIPRL